LKKNTKNNYASVTLKKNPYTGIIRCAECNSPMYSVGGGSTSYRPGYNCSSYMSHGIKNQQKSDRRKLKYSNLGCTGSHYVAEEDLDKLVKHYISKVKDNLSSTLASLDVVKSEQAALRDREQVAVLEDKKAQLKEEIKINERQRIRQIAKDESRENEINQIFDELNEELQQEIESLEIKISFLSDQASRKKELKESYEEVISKFDTLLKKKSFEKTDLHPIIKEITVDQDKVVTIHLYSDITELFELAII